MPVVFPDILNQLFRWFSFCFIDWQFFKGFVGYCSIQKLKQMSLLFLFCHLTLIISIIFLYGLRIFANLLVIIAHKSSQHAIVNNKKKTNQIKTIKSEFIAH